ncbi:MAG: hypothetical protein R6W82_06265 [bacterium]
MPDHEPTRTTARQAALTAAAALLGLTAGCTGEHARLNGVGEEYVRISLAVDVRDPGFVDAYSGPADWREEAREADLSLEDLTERIRLLTRRIESEDAALPRVIFLKGQIRALDTRVRLLRGEEMTFTREVEGLYGFTPRRTPRTELLGVHAELEGLVPGEGPLPHRVQAWDRRFEVPTERILPLFREAAETCRTRTRTILPLPPDEEVNISLVSDRPWNAYNWYRGDGVSSIEINTDLTRPADRILHYVAHEAYPGHHTELTLRDRLLAGEKGWPEFLVYPLYSPQSHISEGGANLGIEMIFTPGEVADFYRETVLPAAGLEGEVDVPRMLRILELRSFLGHAAENAAFMLFEEGAEEGEAVSYLQQWALMTPREAAKRVEFIRAYRGYVFNYRTGYELVRSFVTGDGADRTTRLERFRLLWTTPVSPALLTRWVEAARPAGSGHSQDDPHGG